MLFFLFDARFDLNPSQTVTGETSRIIQGVRHRIHCIILNPERATGHLPILGGPAKTSNAKDVSVISQNSNAPLPVWREKLLDDLLPLNRHKR
jgi:hypothetical protein